MHVVEPARYQARSAHRRWWPYILAPIALVVIGGAINYLRPLPQTTVQLQMVVPTTITPTIDWPSNGQAAIAAGQFGPLGASGLQTPLATASIAKVITALCVLQKAPLTVGQTGATYTVDASDVAIYNTYAAEDGSLLPIQQGEQITEYQALEALMLPSANNIADSLVHWVFGSQATYATYAAEFLQQQGIDNTHIGVDASGFDPSTTSTASDLAALGLVALKNPVLMQIAGQSSAVLPIVGTVQNYDTVLGQNNITGLKTGNNGNDPGAFLFTATTTIGNKTIPLTGAVMGAPDLSTALHESATLAGSFAKGFAQVTIMKSGQSAGVVHTAWGASAALVTTSNLQLVRWQATPITEKHHIDTRLHDGNVGVLSALAGPYNTQTNLRLAHPLTGPSFLWRLTRHQI